MKAVKSVTVTAPSVTDLQPMAGGGFRVVEAVDMELTRRVQSLGDPEMLADRAKAAGIMHSILSGEVELQELATKNPRLIHPAHRRTPRWVWGLVIVATLGASATVSGYVAARVAHSPALSPTAPTAPPAPSEPPPQGRVERRQQPQPKVVASRLP